MKTKFGCWLVQVGMYFRGFKERYSDSVYCDVGGERCAVCKNCGSPTQTTDRICWMCNLYRRYK